MFNYYLADGENIAAKHINPNNLYLRTYIVLLLFTSNETMLDCVHG